MSEKEIRVLYVQPGKYPEERTIPNTLRALQELVGETLDTRHQRQIVKDFLIKFTKKPQKKCQKQILAPDTFADGLFAPA